MSNEDKDFYQPGWIPLAPGTTKYNVTLDVCPLHWRYQDALSLDGIPFWGRTELYAGGGYVAELGYFKEKAYPVLLELLKKDWLDRRTRACFLEFVVYNAQINLFSAGTFLIEFLPTGTLLPYSKIDTLRIYRYLGNNSDILKAVEIIIALVMVFLLYRVIKNIYKQRKSFFGFFWNWIDLLQVVFGLLAVALYFVKMVVLNKSMNDLKTNPFVFVNFQYTILLHEIDNYFVAGIVFVTTLKFLRLLKYQSYIKLLEHVFASFAHNMSWFMLEFLLWFTPFVLFAHLIFGPHLYSYSNVVFSFESTLNALLGAKSFYHLQENEPVMGPLMFISFNLLMVLVLLNIFIAIITSSFNRELDDEHTRATEPELMLFFNEKLRDLFGFDLSKKVGSFSPPKLSPDTQSEISILDDEDEETNNSKVNKENICPAVALRRKRRKAKANKVDLLTEEVILDNKIDSLDHIASKILSMEEVENRFYVLLTVRLEMARFRKDLTQYSEMTTKLK